MNRIKNSSKYFVKILVQTLVKKKNTYYHHHYQHHGHICHLPKSPPVPLSLFMQEKYVLYLKLF